MLSKDEEAYVWGYDIYFVSKTVSHKSNNDLQFLLDPTYRWNKLLINCVTGLLLSTDSKRDNYDAILVIIDWLNKIVYYKLVKIRINVASLAGVIINIVVKYHSVQKSFFSDQSLLFTLKFRFLPCYFLGIKRKLSFTFHQQINGWTKRQNNTIKAHLYIIVN